MKTILTILLIIFFFSCNNNRYKQEEGVLYEGQSIAIPDYYRKLFGFDSVQFVHKLRIRFGDKYVPEANFWHPNRWDAGVVKNDTVFVHDTIHDALNTSIDDALKPLLLQYYKGGYMAGQNIIIDLVNEGKLTDKIAQQKRYADWNKMQAQINSK